MRRLTTIRYLLAGLFLWIAITCGSGGQATEPAPGGESISSGAAAEPTTASPTTLFPSASALAPVSVADGVTLAARWGSQDNGDGEVFGPHGIALDVVGNVYVTDVNNNRAQVFGADGRFLRKWG